MAPVASCSGRTAVAAMVPLQLRHAGRARKPPPAMLSSPSSAPSVRFFDPPRAACRGTDPCSTSRCVLVPRPSARASAGSGQQ